MKRASSCVGPGGLLLAGLLLFGCQGPPVDKPKDVPATAPKVVHREFNDVARFLAGLSPEEGSRLAEASARPAFMKYAESFDKSWSNLKMSKLDAIRKWADMELRETAHDKKTVFYPFAGPDFLHAHTFFPGAEKFVLIALEPIGTVPKIEPMNPAAMDQLFASVDHSLQTVISFSFFKTLDMKVDLKKDVDGALPLLMIFLARTGNRINDVKDIEIGADGGVTGPTPGSAPDAGLKGVEIVFETPGSAVQKRLDYFSVNIDNDHLKKSPAFLKYVDTLAPVNTYLKSASYLMYKPYFSTISSAILDHSAFVLEDDSAIPYRYFPAEKWDVTLFGVYTSPIEMFQEHQQPDLVAAYAKPGAARPLPFGIGYKWQAGSSNLLAAKHKP